MSKGPATPTQPPHVPRPRSPNRTLASNSKGCVTEAAAIGVGQWVGMGDKNAADGAAVDAMPSFLSTVRLTGRRAGRDTTPSASPPSSTTPKAKKHNG